MFNDGGINLKYVENINRFVDITEKQFYNVYHVIFNIINKKNYGEVVKVGENYNDWSINNTVIKNQRGYNSSYIFAALTAIQYQINKQEKSKQWVSLSVQEIIDCCKECLVTKKPETVYEYIKLNGVSVDKQYPYQNSRFDNSIKKCRNSQTLIKRYFISGYKQIKNCQALQKYLVKNPIVVGLDGRNFNEYEYGIFSRCQRKTTHYGILVGIGYNHWKIQNSWGNKWGENGYIRIGGGDCCGVCLRGSVPMLDNMR